jgi:hypothetical protein
MPFYEPENIDLKGRLSYGPEFNPRDTEPVAHPKVSQPVALCFDSDEVFGEVILHFQSKT